jgi:hypothetical protein
VEVGNVVEGLGDAEAAGEVNADVSVESRMVDEEEV